MQTSVYVNRENHHLLPKLFNIGILQQMFKMSAVCKKHKHGDSDATAWQLCRWCAGPCAATASTDGISTNTIIVKFSWVQPLMELHLRATEQYATCHLTQVNTPHLKPSRTGWYSIYLPWMDGRLDWPKWLIKHRDDLSVYTEKHPSK